jgi:hypothetical protein
VDQGKGVVSECGVWVAGNGGGGEFECLAVVPSLDEIEGAMAFFGAFW